MVYLKTRKKKTFWDILTFRKVRAFDLLNWFSNDSVQCLMFSAVHRQTFYAIFAAFYRKSKSQSLLLLNVLFIDRHCNFLIAKLLQKPHKCFQSCICNCKKNHACIHKRGENLKDNMHKIKKSLLWFVDAAKPHDQCYLCHGREKNRKTSQWTTVIKIYQEVLDFNAKNVQTSS